MGGEIELGTADQSEVRAKDSLGLLDALGLAQSYPHMLVEAYTNPDAYAGLRAEMLEAEAEDELEWHEPYTAEDESGDEQEMSDEETEEAL